MSNYQQKISGKGVGDPYQLTDQNVITYTRDTKGKTEPFEIHVTRKSSTNSGEEHYVYETRNWTVSPITHPLEKVEESYKDFAAEMTKSKTLEQYKKLFNDEPSLKNKINRIVVLALGSFSAVKEGDPCYLHNGTLVPYTQSTILYQLALVESLGRYLPNVGSSNIFFQDPAFTDVDKEFLGKRGYEVKEWPYVYNLMTKTTLLMDMGYIPAAMHAFEIEHPAMYIGREFPSTAQEFETFWDRSRLNLDHDPPKNWLTEKLFAFGAKKHENIMPDDPVMVPDSQQKTTPWPRLNQYVYYLKSADLDAALAAAPPTLADQ